MSIKKLYLNFAYKFHKTQNKPPQKQASVMYIDADPIYF